MLEHLKILAASVQIHSLGLKCLLPIEILRVKYRYCILPFESVQNLLPTPGLQQNPLEENTHNIAQHMRHGQKMVCGNDINIIRYVYIYIRIYMYI